MWATPHRGMVTPPSASARAQAPVEESRARRPQGPDLPRPRRLPRPLSESPQDVLRAPQFLLVLQTVFLQQFVLGLDALRFPRVGGPLELRSGKLRIAQRLTPWPVPSSLLSSLPSSGRLPPPSSPGRRRGRPSSSPRRSGRSGRWTACVAHGPSVRSRGGRPCTNESSS